MKNFAKTIILALALVMVIPLAQARQIKGSGNVIKETRELKNFTALDVGGAFNVELIKSTESKIIIETDDNIMPTITTKVSGGTLEIDNTRDINNPTKLQLTIYYQQLEELDISGAADLYSEDMFIADFLDLDISGAAEITLQIQVNNLDADFSGAADINLEGTVNNAKIEASGASTISAYGLEILELGLEASGASSVKILVLKEMSIDSSGASSVRYKGSPSIKIIDVSGASSFRKG
ncbi:MAG: hypothetical protein B7C24_04070 [Bacteroidetes bacterium 4572_77]|nr:MAG: hypothetical protein B7C24_04070 [Bacteroidetes bacterium 4572_77]